MAVNNLRRVFAPTPEEQREDLERYKAIYNSLKPERGCSTCKHCVHAISYPSFVTGEECECDAGLKCDTVLFTVKNCKKWEGKEWQ